MMPNTTVNFREWLEINESRDACYHKVKSRYKVWPSAYASGALVKCRKMGAANWGNSKNESTTKCSFCNDSTTSLEICDICSGLGFGTKIKEGTFDLEKDKGLHGWFARNKGKGWIDCKASTKDHKVPCGRSKAGKGTDREYPACRPTFGACNKKGTKRKKNSNSISWK